MKIFYLREFYFIVINHQIIIKFYDCFSKDKVREFFLLVFEEPIIYKVSP
jgi:hypothetical protein